MHLLLLIAGCATAFASELEPKQINDVTLLKQIDICYEPGFTESRKTTLSELSAGGSRLVVIANYFSGQWHALIGWQCNTAGHFNWRYMRSTGAVARSNIGCLVQHRRPGTL